MLWSRRIPNLPETMLLVGSTMNSLLGLVRRQCAERDSSDIKVARRCGLRITLKACLQQTFKTLKIARYPCTQSSPKRAIFSPNAPPLTPYTHEHARTSLAYSAHLTASPSPRPNSPCLHRGHLSSHGLTLYNSIAARNQPTEFSRRKPG